jgi:hypothetical protein
MPAGDPTTGEGAANWSRINNGVKELIDQILVSHLLVHALDSTESLPVEGIKSVTADPASLAGMEAPSDHLPVIARFNLKKAVLVEWPQPVHPMFLALPYHRAPLPP